MASSYSLTCHSIAITPYPGPPLHHIPRKRLLSLSIRPSPKNDEPSHVRLTKATVLVSTGVFTPEWVSHTPRALLLRRPAR
jgi:hypothetical protein